MPIVNPTTSQYTLMEVSADMKAGRIHASLEWQVDGKALGTIEVEATGDEFIAALMAAPTAASRADDIADLIYQIALAKGVVSGTIT
jgi:hypothetical protein